jgi:hypothetical protein
MGQTTRYGLRYPERSDPAEAWTAVGNLAEDVERMYSGSAAVPVVASGWAWYGGVYGDGITIRTGRVVTIDGLLKRTGTSITLSATPTPLLTVTHAPDPSRTFTGMLFAMDGRVVRWYLPGGQTSLQVMHPGGAGTYTFAPNSNLSVAVRYVTAA